MKIQSKWYRFKVAILGYHVGQLVRVNADENGVPLKKLWRDLEKDSETDGCIEIVSFPDQLEEVDKSPSELKTEEKVKTKSKKKSKQVKNSEVMNDDAS